ncbi:hypothetical protein HELRODRAFT_180932 [Helobdella robusta]|uniref:Uncharacterized protein n=1 Tax=Helobdella robusta TaxID=6412 RepID=T1FGF9_HELRO|nr:hypothetical protein HELRODRAFT_180932 [Helobdella robusta]ESN93402.1 hypothetical protein HELRODRAFT_180932 [Helobdella robusta]
MAHYELPKQIDGHNCGIFIYMVVKYTLDKSKPIGNEFDPIRCRLKIFDDSNGGISPLLKAQRNRQIFTVNLEQEIAKGIGREELLKIDLFWKNKCFLGLTENGPKGNDESLQNLKSIITSNYNALERKEKSMVNAFNRIFENVHKTGDSFVIYDIFGNKIVY